MIKNIDELEPGMVAAKDVTTRSAILLKAGATLTAETIRHLKKWDVTRVDVVAPEPEEQEEAAEVPLEENPAYLKEKEAVEAAFSDAGSDQQMAVLKRCFLRVLTEKYSA